jgi:hypothetical protein
LGKASKGVDLIVSDQPQIFQNKIVAALSSANDGNTSFLTGLQGRTLENRKDFLGKAGIDAEHTTFMQVRYSEAEHFTRYKVVNETHKKMGLEGAKSSFVADAIVVTEPNCHLFVFGRLRRSNYL